MADIADVRIHVEDITWPTYLPALPDKGQCSEKRVYQEQWQSVPTTDHRAVNFWIA